MTPRSHETIRVGLRRIIRDPGVRPNVRMDAIKLLMHAEGQMQRAAGQPTCSNDRPATHQPSEANLKRMRELLRQAQERKPDRGYLRRWIPLFAHRIGAGPTTQALSKQLKLTSAIRTEINLNCVICDGDFPVSAVFKGEMGASLIYHPQKTQALFLVRLRN